MLWSLNLGFYSLALGHLGLHEVVHHHGPGVWHTRRGGVGQTAKCGRRGRRAAIEGVRAEAQVPLLVTVHACMHAGRQAGRKAGAACAQQLPWVNDALGASEVATGRS